MFRDMTIKDFEGFVHETTIASDSGSNRNKRLEMWVTPVTGKIEYLIKWRYNQKEDFQSEMFSSLEGAIEAYNSK